jgi:hypothetical protein
LWDRRCCVCGLSFLFAEIPGKIFDYLPDIRVGANRTARDHIVYLVGPVLLRHPLPGDHIQSVAGRAHALDYRFAGAVGQAGLSMSIENDALKHEAGKGWNGQPGQERSPANQSHILSCSIP